VGAFGIAVEVVAVEDTAVEVVAAADIAVGEVAGAVVLDHQSSSAHRIYYKKLNHRGPVAHIYYRMAF